MQRLTLGLSKSWSFGTLWCPQLWLNLTINKKEKQTGRAGQTCSGATPPTPVQMETAGASEGPPQEGRGGLCLPEPFPGQPRVVARWLSHWRRRYCSHGRQSPRQRSKDPISPPAPLLPPPPENQTASVGPVEGWWRLPFLHDGRASFLGPALGGAASHPHRPRGCM